MPAKNEQPEHIRGQPDLQRAFGMSPERSQPVTTDVFDFLAHMPTGDHLELIVLKGHLLIEQKLEQIIRAVVAHGDLLENVTIGYHVKAHLAKAMCWCEHASPFWEFILALNGLRNNFAHSLGDARTEGKLQSALKAHEATLNPEEIKDIANMSAAGRLRHGVLQTLGFLNSFLADAIAYRTRVDELLEVLRTIGRE